MGAGEVSAFLTALAVRGRVGSSTQDQALSALLFLYREVLAVDLPWLDSLVRAKPRSAYRSSSPVMRSALLSSTSTAACA